MRPVLVLLLIAGLAASSLPADATPAVTTTVEMVEERAVLSEDGMLEAVPPARPPATPDRVLAARADEPPPTPPPER